MSVLIVVNELNQINISAWHFLFSQSPCIYPYDSHETLLRFSGKGNKTQKLKKDEYYFKKLFLLYVYVCLGRESMYIMTLM